MISHELIAIDIPHMIHNINIWGKDEINPKPLYFSIEEFFEKKEKERQVNKLNAQISTQNYCVERAFERNF